MQSYKNLVKEVLEYGEIKDNRTGINCLTLPGGGFIKHDMKNGFPILTTKKMGIKTMATELEFFINGLTDKQWLKDRKCNIWNEWCNPSKIPKGLNEKERKLFQLNENDLGPIYGYQWRNFNSENYDQLSEIVITLKNNPNDRRMVCSAWNPAQTHEMALPPCHITWGVQHINGKLHLHWSQRSCDLFLGVPFDIVLYGLLLELLCKETGFIPGIITGSLWDLHIYENHIPQMKEQIQREPKKLPILKINNWSGMFDWVATDCELLNYNFHPAIKGKVAI